MRYLETKVPPPILGVLIGFFFWWKEGKGSACFLDSMVQVSMLTALIVTSAVIISLAFISFVKAKTTVNPISPESATTLVQSGIYRFTRNPMYVGEALLLTAWMVYLSSWWGVSGTVFFILYLNRFQIQPEELLLKRKFGKPYEKYRSRVPRWIKPPFSKHIKL